jgi:uncharacterized membrane protein
MQPPTIPAEAEAIRPFFGYLTFGIDIAAGVIIAISIIRGFIMYVRILQRSPLEQTREEGSIKRFVGNGLILALDLEIGSDIIRTIPEPSVTNYLIR